MGSKKAKLKNSGFTLIEVMIAMAIMVFIAYSVNEATTQTYRLRDRLLYEGDFQNGIRLTIDLVMRDLSMIYSPTLITSTTSTPQANTNQNSELQSGELAQSTNFWGAALNLSGLRPARFQGEAQKMSFISASHLRVYKNSPECDLSKITYELKKDGSQELLSDEDMNRLKDTWTLIKTENTNVFDLEDRNTEKFSRDYKLLSGIKSLKLRYFSVPKDKWFDTWDSEKEETKNLIPDLIEVTLEAIGPQDLNFDGIFKIKPEIPVNGLDARF